MIKREEYQKYTKICQKNLSDKPTMDHLRLAWQDDLVRGITKEQWQTAQTHRSSICARHGLLQFKIMHRLHWSKQKLNKIFPSVEPSCDRCGLGPATLGHMFWSCPKLSHFWDNIFKTLSHILHRPINKDPLATVLGIMDSSMTESNMEHSMVSFVSLLARRLIRLWKQKTVPSYSNLMTDVMRHLELEKDSY